MFSSPFKRAVDTIAPFAAHASLRINLEERLSGRRMSEAISKDPWHFFEKSWKDSEYKIDDAESGRECGQRVRACLSHLSSHNPGKTILAVSHSNAIGYFMKQIDKELSFEWFSAMTCPALFDLYFDGEVFVWNRAFNFPHGKIGR